MTALPTMPPGWRATNKIRGVVLGNGTWSRTHRAREWVFDPAGASSSPDQLIDAPRQWVEEPIFDGIQACCHG